MSITVWQSIKKKLRVRINPILVKVWIDPLEATYDNGVVKLVAPNEFVEKWVRDNLLSSIRDAAGEVLDEEVGVVISRGNFEPPEALANDSEGWDSAIFDDGERIVGCITRLHRRFRVCIGLEKPMEPFEPESEGWGFDGVDGDSSLVDEVDDLEQPDFDEVLDAVMEAFGISFREIMGGDSEEVELARRALYYLCARYEVPPEEVALNMDCTVSEVRNGAQKMDQEIAEAIDAGEDLDQLLIRLFHKT